MKNPSNDLEYFTMTENHLKLLRRLTVNADMGQPNIDIKRPFGNSNIECDIAEIVGMQEPNWEEGEEWSDEDESTIKRLLAETATALQVVLQSGQMKEGDYVRRKYIGQWTTVPF